MDDGDSIDSCPVLERPLSGQPLLLVFCFVYQLALFPTADYIVHRHLCPPVRWQVFYFRSFSFSFLGNSADGRWLHSKYVANPTHHFLVHVRVYVCTLRLLGLAFCSRSGLSNMFGIWHEQLLLKCVEFVPLI